MTQPLDECPACGDVSRPLTDWEFSGLGDSVFNYVACFYSCSACGLVYIQNTSDARLARFYQEECSYFDKPHFDVTSPANVEKYEAYRAFVSANGLERVDVTDVGCGRGGFLSWLKQHGWEGECCGVDVDAKSIPLGGGVATGLRFEHGDAFALPFEGDTRALLTYFHVLEHIRDLDRLLTEARRVLRPDGHILIEVPDAERYSAHPIGSGFWIGIREHVNHFSASALAQLLRRNGFSVLRVARRMLPTPEFSYPSLMLLAQRGDDTGVVPSLPPGEIPAFVLESRHALEAQVALVSSLLAEGTKVTFWGCSAQLMSLLPLLDLRTVVLCDSAQSKQSSHYLGMAIRSPADVPPEGTLVIAPYLHGALIEQAALAMGWQRDAIYRLQ